MDTEAKNEEQNGQELRGKELYELEKKQRDQEKNQARRNDKLTEAPKKIGRYVLYILIIIALIGAGYWFIVRQPNLPSTSMQGHIEESPSAHIVTEPIPDVIQRHMLEHADGGSIPGVLIQYNCEDYTCEQDLIQNLTNLVEQYPDNVYLAPNTYDGKIILTKLGERKILDGFNEQAIRDFIK